LAVRFFFLSIEGSLDAQLSDISADLKIRVFDQALADGTNVPNIEIFDSTINIPDHGI